MVLLIIIPFLNGYNWEYTLFSDKPMCWLYDVVCLFVLLRLPCLFVKSQPWFNEWRFLFVKTYSKTLCHFEWRGNGLGYRYPIFKHAYKFIWKLWKSHHSPSLMFHLATFSHQAAFFENEIANPPFQSIPLLRGLICSYIFNHTYFLCSCSKECHFAFSPFIWFHHNKNGGFPNRHGDPSWLGFILWKIP